MGADVQTGDRIRVTLESRARRVEGDRVRFENLGPTEPFEWGWVDIGSVEKIEPPVEVFKPGDVVRHKGDGTVYFIRGNGGFINLTANPCKEDDYRFTFTSQFYEKVSIE